MKTSPFWPALLIALPMSLTSCGKAISDRALAEVTTKRNAMQKEFDDLVVEGKALSKELKEVSGYSAKGASSAAKVTDDAAAENEILVEMKKGLVDQIEKLKADAAVHQKWMMQK